MSPKQFQITVTVWVIMPTFKVFHTIIRRSDHSVWEQDLTICPLTICPCCYKHMNEQHFKPIVIGFGRHKISNLLVSTRRPRNISAMRYQPWPWLYCRRSISSASALVINCSITSIAPLCYRQRPCCTAIVRTVLFIDVSFYNHF